MADTDSFDNELNAIMEGNVSSQPNTGPSHGTPVPQTQGAVEKTYKAAGRDWKADELAKAHDSLTKEFGSRNKDWQELKELREVKARLNADPEFARFFKGSVEAYQKMRDAGQSQTTAQQKTGLPPEVVAKLEKVDRFETIADRLELQDEENQLMRKHSLDAETLKKVEDYSLAHQGIPLEQSYKMMMWDLHSEKIAEQKTKEQAQRKEVSRTSATPSHIQPSAKGVSLKSDADWRASAGKELGKYFSE
jgi:hypothetical protein